MINNKKCCYYDKLNFGTKKQKTKTNKKNKRKPNIIWFNCSFVKTNIDRGFLNLLKDKSTKTIYIKKSLTYITCKLIIYVRRSYRGLLTH